MELRDTKLSLGFNHIGMILVYQGACLEFISLHLITLRQLHKLCTSTVENSIHVSDLGLKYRQQVYCMHGGLHPDTSAVIDDSATLGPGLIYSLSFRLSSGVS